MKQISKMIWNSKFARFVLQASLNVPSDNLLEAFILTSEFFSESDLLSYGKGLCYLLWVICIWLQILKKSSQL